MFYRMLNGLRFAASLVVWAGVAVFVMGGLLSLIGIPGAATALASGFGVALVGLGGLGVVLVLTMLAVQLRDA